MYLSLIQRLECVCLVWHTNLPKYLGDRIKCIKSGSCDASSWGGCVIQLI